MAWFHLKVAHRVNSYMKKKFCQLITKAKKTEKSRVGPAPLEKYKRDGRYGLAGGIATPLGERPLNLHSELVCSRQAHHPTRRQD